VTLAHLAMGRPERRCPAQRTASGPAAVGGVFRGRMLSRDFLQWCGFKATKGRMSGPARLFWRMPTPPPLELPVTFRHGGVGILDVSLLLVAHRLLLLLIRVLWCQLGPKLMHGFKLVFMLIHLEKKGG